MNKADVYYFSGTGNSFVVARDIAGQISGTLLPIASAVKKDRIRTNSEVVGIVFPVYFAWFGGIPLIVERFVGKLENMQSKYIFAVCTYANATGPAIDDLSKLVESVGGKLAAGFAVNMPYNYVFGARLSKTTVEKQRELFDDWKKKLEIICQCIHARQEGMLETDVSSVKGLSGWLLGKMKGSSALKKMYHSQWQQRAGFPKGAEVPFHEIVPCIDKSFRSDGNCGGCGICGKVCPVDNIEMVGNKPAWLHHCEQCFACLQWCPAKAIHLGGETKGQRYHHPDATLADMIIQREITPEVSL